MASMRFVRQLLPGVDLQTAQVLIASQGLFVHEGHVAACQVCLLSGW